MVDESWRGLELQAQFSNTSTDREPIPVALDETMTCFVPSEATAQPGKVYVALAGYDDGVQIKLTDLLHYSNAKTGADPSGGVPPEEQTPGYLNQIKQILGETKEVAQSVRDDADQGKFNGKPGKNGEPGKSPKEEGGTWWLWNEEEQKWVDTGVLVAGKNGISPKVETQPVTGGTRVVITDADGEKSFDVLNGKNGNPGKNGETPNITIGRVDTLPSGSKATAEITGQTPNLTLNMCIPQGREGPAGLGLPTPTPEDAGMVPVVNPDGDGYVFGKAGGGGLYKLLYSGMIEESDVMNVILSSEKPIKDIVIYVSTPVVDGPYSLQCYLGTSGDLYRIVFGIGNIFMTTKNVGVVFATLDKSLGMFTQTAAKSIGAWYSGKINEEMYYAKLANNDEEFVKVAITRNQSGKTYPIPVGTEFTVGVRYE